MIETRGQILDESWQALTARASRLVGQRVGGTADADDVVQEVLLRVWRQGARRRDDDRFGAWLFRVSHNAVNDLLRDRQRQQRWGRSHEPDETPAPPPIDDEAAQARRCLASVLRPFIAELPTQYRQVMEWSELDELPHAVIAERLGLSVSGVKSRVQRGRARVKAMLERCCSIAVDARGGPVSCESRCRCPSSD